MKCTANAIRVIVVGMILAAAIIGSTGVASAKQIWGETVGPVSAIVENTDSPQGLAIRVAPYDNARVIGFASGGTVVQGTAEFSQGWMKLQHPYAGGWIQVNYLRPREAFARVAQIDHPDGCLRIRRHPLSSGEVVDCVPQGTELVLTGVWSRSDWAEVKAPTFGWVYAPQISTAIDPNRPSGKIYAYRPPIHNHAPYAEPPDYGPGPYPPAPYAYEPSDPRPWEREYSGPYHHGPWKRYGLPNYGVRVSPGGGKVAVDAGPVNVRVRKGRGVGVRVGPVGVRVGPGGFSLDID